MNPVMLLGVLSFLVSSFIVQAHAGLEEDLQTILEREAILTVAGIKPVTSYDSSLSEKYPNVASLVASLDQAKKEGRLLNPELGWFYYHLRVTDVPDPQTTQHLFLYHRGRIDQMRRDPEVLRLLKEFGFSTQDPVEVWIEKYKQFQDEPFVRKLPPYKAYRNHIIAGLFYGYPPKEVEAFARSSALLSMGWSYRKAENRVYGKSVRGKEATASYQGEIPGTSVGYLSATGNDSAFETNLQALGQGALWKYWALRGRGFSVWDIFNRWEDLDSPCTILLENKRVPGENSPEAPPKKTD